MSEKYRDRAIAHVVLQTAFGNIGDALINRELIKILSASLDVCVYTGRASSNFIQSLSLSDLPNVRVITGGFLTAFQHIRTNIDRYPRQIYVLMPGGNKGEKSLPKFIQNRAYNSFLKRVKNVGVKIIQLGVSFEDLGPRYQKVIKDRALIIDKLVLRDEESRKYLDNLSIHSSGLIPDLAFNLDYDFVKLQCDQDAKKKKTVAISFRSGPGFASETEVETFVDQLLTEYPAQSYRFICQVENDKLLMKQLYERWKESIVQCEFFDISKDLNSYSAAYKGCDAIFSNRLHAILLAMSVGAKPFAILRDGSDKKIRSIFHQINISDRIMSLPVASTELLNATHRSMTNLAIDQIRTQQLRLRSEIAKVLKSIK
jgi:polysaccharide pyruvyl transferase WcaK-like protein